MAEKANLVDSIKQLQREGAGPKQSWWDYCDGQLGGVRDPNRHDAATLRAFLDLYQNGDLPPPSSGGGGRGGGGDRRGGGGGGPPPRGGGGFSGDRRGAPPPRSSYQNHSAVPPPSGYGGGGGHRSAPPQQSYGGYRDGGYGGGGGGHQAQGSSLTEFVKTGQRQSAQWKSAWQTYCAIYGNGFNDPAKYDDNFVREFLNYVGELAASGLADIALEQGIEVGVDGAPAPGKRMRGGDDFRPPAKRQATGGGAGGDARKDPLVQKIKDLQRSSPEAKQQWWEFCDTHGGGVKDPNRHEWETLELFLQSIE
eukprot:TRINITY_DN108610_c0_g1_i1.p1 TRINITY_DN108610_c0_g1~~TRINITY_DN108610_c0_g1_i1.p1  ORF type:complete len:309 (-),score=74.96 TRINITY_DN108610_c0_g1_i1:52-978(-)